MQTKFDINISSIYAFVVIISIFTAVATSTYLILGIPIVLVAAYFAFVDFKKLYFLLLFFIPISVEIFLPNGLGTDLPTEPLMVVLMGIFIVYSLGNRDVFPKHFYYHPITIAIFLHISWIFITMITSQVHIVSFKFLLAKIWYIIPFYFVTSLIIRSIKDIRILIISVLVPLLFTIIWTLTKHYFQDFTFVAANHVMYPFYRNHVNYAAIIAMFFPFALLLPNLYDRKLSKIYYLIFPIMLIAVWFSFTRVAYIALLIELVAYIIIRFRLTVFTFAISLVLGVAGIFYLLNNNKYMDYAPEYKKAITHEDFDNLIAATYKLEDVSTMERVYRWVAGFKMVGERPILGFGPGNFFFHYKQYTLSKFKTYVSRNPEKSGIHSYYLMTTVEQGLPGLLIFLTLIFSILFTAERVYHGTEDKKRKTVMLMVFLSVISILAMLLINDLIESDKIGPFLFIGAALVINADLKNKGIMKSSA